MAMELILSGGVFVFVSFADVAVETNVEIRQPDEFIVGRKYVCAVAALGFPQFIQSAGTASGPIDQPEHNSLTVSRMNDKETLMGLLGGGSTIHLIQLDFIGIPIGDVINLKKAPQCRTFSVPIRKARSVYLRTYLVPRS